MRPETLTSEGGNCTLRWRLGLVAPAQNHPIAYPTRAPRAPHAVQLYPTVRQPLAFGAAGLRLVLSPRSATATLQIARLSVLQTSASPRCDLLRAREHAKPGSETCQERRGWVELRSEWEVREETERRGRRWRRSCGGGSAAGRLAWVKRQDPPRMLRAASPVTRHWKQPGCPRPMRGYSWLFLSQIITQR